MSIWEGNVKRIIALAFATWFAAFTITAASAGWNDSQKQRWSNGAQRNCTQQGKCP
jgi:hypothetical protein